VVWLSQVPWWGLLHRLWRAFARHPPAFHIGLAVRLRRWLEQTLYCVRLWKFTLLFHVALRSRNDATVIFSL